MTCVLGLAGNSLSSGSHWPFGLLLCKLTYFMFNFNMYSSVFLLVLISVDRFVMVMFPVWSRNHRSPWKFLLPLFENFLGTIVQHRTYNTEFR
uniref:G-protein coupled receptors family 1 profile domain-containing protein n=1 Tax=Neogobius melanostomus TaxID=47308 RepID=A0A8C6WPW5_9GOBI